MMPMQNISRTAMRDLTNMICDEELGRGIGRVVYACSLDPSIVIKIEQGGGSFQNVLEWETWQQLAHTRVARWLAPCVNISPCGIVLLMKRVTPLPHDLKNGTRIPEFLTDRKRSNYGMIDGRVVCCDYGSNLAINHGALASKQTRTEWWA